MAVYRYFKTISGFSGYRVVRTMGSRKDYRQEWISAKEYGWDLAKALAYSLSEDWDKEAAAIKQTKESNRLTYRFSQRHDRPNCIVTGLSANISFRTPDQTGWGGYEVAPCFIVRPKGKGRSPKEFRIRKLGFDGAYAAAVDYYADVFNMDEYDKILLLERRPPASLFTGYLLDRLTERVGVENAPTREELESLLYYWETEAA